MDHRSRARYEARLGRKRTAAEPSDTGGRRTLNLEGEAHGGRGI